MTYADRHRRRKEEDLNLSMDEIDKRCHDKHFSMAFFLAPDETLSDIIQKDAETLKRLNITNKQIADRLEVLVGRYQTSIQTVSTPVGMPWPPNSEGHRGQPNCSLVEDKYAMCMVGTKGMQECPFGSCGYGSADYVIYNLKTELWIRFGGLQIHLIRDHGFFEGNVLYRLEPEEVVSVLELVPGVDYTPVYEEKTHWSMSYGNSNPSEEELDITGATQLFEGFYYRKDGKKLAVINFTTQVPTHFSFEGHPVKYTFPTKYSLFVQRTESFIA